MKRLTVMCLLALSTVASVQAATQTDDQIVGQLSTMMEGLYGQSVNDVDSALHSRFIGTTPLRDENNQPLYMVPVSSPKCASLSLQTESRKVVNWETMAWNRAEQNLYGEACEKAFKNQR